MGKKFVILVAILLIVLGCNIFNEDESNKKLNKVNLKIFTALPLFMIDKNSTDGYEKMLNTPIKLEIKNGDKVKFTDEIKTDISKDSLDYSLEIETGNYTIELEYSYDSTILNCNKTINIQEGTNKIDCILVFKDHVLFVGKIKYDEALVGKSISIFLSGTEKRYIGGLREYKNGDNIYISILPGKYDLDAGFHGMVSGDNYAMSDIVTIGENGLVKDIELVRDPRYGKISLDYTLTNDIPVHSDKDLGTLEVIIKNKETNKSKELSVDLIKDQYIYSFNELLEVGEYSVRAKLESINHYDYAFDTEHILDDIVIEEDHHIIKSNLIEYRDNPLVELNVSYPQNMDNKYIIATFENQESGYVYKLDKFNINGINQQLFGSLPSGTYIAEVIVTKNYPGYFSDILYKGYVQQANKIEIFADIKLDLNLTQDDNAELFNMNVSAILPDEIQHIEFSDNSFISFKASSPIGVGGFTTITPLEKNVSLYEDSLHLNKDYYTLEVVIEASDLNGNFFTYKSIIDKFKLDSNRLENNFNFIKQDVEYFFINIKYPEDLNGKYIDIVIENVETSEKNIIWERASDSKGITFFYSLPAGNYRFTVYGEKEGYLDHPGNYKLVYPETGSIEAKGVQTIDVEINESHKM